MTTVAKVYANWRSQAFIINATLDAQGHSRASERLNQLLTELDQIWTEEFGAEYTGELAEFFTEIGYQPKRLTASVHILKTGEKK